MRAQLRDQRMLALDVDVAAFAQGCQHRGERHADLAILVRQIKERSELLVPACQPEVAVKHRDPLLHLVKRDLQQVAVLLKRFAGVVQKAEGVKRQFVVPLKQERQDQAR